MRRLFLTAALIGFSVPALAQDLMLFDPSSFGRTILPQRQSLLDEVQLEAQVGTYNNEFVSTYGPDSVFARTGRAVGRLDILTNVGHAPCTAFLVRDNLLVTNHHCVPGILDNPRMKERGAESIVAVQFKAGYLRDGIEEGVTSFMVDPAPVETSEALDYTVLRVIGDANAEFGALDLSTAVPSDRAPLWVIGHPMGEAQRISREKCRADSPALASGRLRHTCDTLPGNSGSPVIDADRKQVVALHHAGSRAGAVNFAVPMADILAQSKVLKAAEAGHDPLAEERARLAKLKAELDAERARLKADAVKAEREPLNAAAPVKVAEAPETECDRLAADPLDPQKIAGVAGIHDMMRIDRSRAIPACELAVRQYPAEPRLAFQLARALDAEHRFEEAIRYYQRAQAAGHVASMTMIGWLYQNGQGAEKDLAEAGRWFQLAADKGDIQAFHALGYRLKTGDGVEQDLEAARLLYRRAADRGAMIAMYGLGNFYDKGEGVEKDLAEAARWYAKAVETGNHPGTLWKLATMYSRGKGVAVDHRKSALYAVQAILHGSTQALEETKRQNTPVEFRREMQRLLKDRGAYDGAIDGAIGPGTRAALDAVFDTEVCGPGAAVRC